MLESQNRVSHELPTKYGVALIQTLYGTQWLAILPTPRRSRTQSANSGGFSNHGSISSFSAALGGTSRRQPGMLFGSVHHTPHRAARRGIVSHRNNTPLLAGNPALAGATGTSTTSRLYIQLAGHSSTIGAAYIYSGITGTATINGQFPPITSGAIFSPASPSKVTVP
jgi:hypothetical protein